MSFGVADGVGGWIESGVDPALFSQALMYHAHRYSRNAWAGEPEIDPTMDYEEREQIEGWEMTPYECLDLAYGGVLREKYVQAGAFQIQSSYLSFKPQNPIFKVQVQRALLALTHLLVFCGQQSKPMHPLQHSNNLLNITHSLGDSGFSIIRQTSIIHRQNSQTHFFNCPKLVSSHPRRV